MKKRILLVALCLSMVMATAVGCSNNTGTGGGEGGEGGSTGNVEVKVGFWPSDDDSTNIATYEKFKADFEAANEGVTITPAYYQYALDSFIPLAEAGQLPTVFETWYTEPATLVAGGYIRDVTAEMAARGWDAKLDSNVKDILTVDGKLYGCPRDTYGLGIEINIDLFKEAGLVADDGTIAYPKTLDELADTAKTIKDKTGKAGMVILSQDNTGGWQFSNIAWNFGAEFVKEEGGKLVANVNSPECVKAMEWIKSLKWEKNCLPEGNLFNWGKGHELIGTGDAAMYIAAPDGIAVPVRDYGLGTNSIGLIPFPEGPNGHYSLAGGTFYAFASNASDDQVKAAFDFIEFIGKAPVFTEASKTGLISGYVTNKEDGIPVLPAVSPWNDDEYNNAVEEVRAEYNNVDDYEHAFGDYFEQTASIVRPEEKYDAQGLYATIDPVIQALLQDENTDIQAGLDKANEDYQAILDKEFNNAE